MPNNPNRYPDLERLAAMTHGQRLDELAKSELRLARLRAEQLQLLAAIATGPPSVSLAGHEDKNRVRERVAGILGCSPDVAGQQLVHAAALARMSGAIEMLERGEVTADYPRVLAVRTETREAALTRRHRPGPRRPTGPQP